MVTSGANAGDTISMLALITEQGDFVTVARSSSSGCASIGFGQGSTIGSSASATADWAFVTYTSVQGVSTNCIEPDGSTSGTSVLTGTVTQRATLALTDMETTSAGTVDPAVTSTLTYDSRYELAPSLSMIAGNYSDGSDTFTISASGTIFEQDPNTNCTINGQLSIPDNSYNAYSFSISYTSCTGTSVALNGTTATGLGFYDNTVTPNQLNVAWHGMANGQPYVFYGVFPHQ